MNKKLKPEITTDNNFYCASKICDPNTEKYQCMLKIELKLKLTIIVLTNSLTQVKFCCNVKMVTKIA